MLWEQQRGSSFVQGLHGDFFFLELIGSNALQKINAILLTRQIITKANYFKR
jgi:hypothetical protein